MVTGEFTQGLKSPHCQITIPPLVLTRSFARTGIGAVSMLPHPLLSSLKKGMVDPANRIECSTSFRFFLPAIIDPGNHYFIAYYATAPSLL